MNTTYDKEADPVLSREDAIAILNTPDDQLQELIDRASALRHKYKGNRVSIHILTNARSGNCSQDCAYCAQSCRSKADIDKYKTGESSNRAVFTYFKEFIFFKINGEICKYKTKKE